MRPRFALTCNLMKSRHSTIQSTETLRTLLTLTPDLSAMLALMVVVEPQHGSHSSTTSPLLSPITEFCEQNSSVDLLCLTLFWVVLALMPLLDSPKPREYSASTVCLLVGVALSPFCVSLLVLHCLSGATMSSVVALYFLAFATRLLLCNRLPFYSVCELVGGQLVLTACLGCHPAVAAYLTLTHLTYAAACVIPILALVLFTRAVCLGQVS
jgi:hypothetical protein